MQYSDLETNTSAAIIVTDQIAAFPTILERLFAEHDANQRHYVLIQNSDQKNITIEQIRDLKSSTIYSLGEREQTEIVILWADLLTIPAQQAFLKLLEEPPPRTRLWLVTDKPQTLLETIRSRCVSLHQIAENSETMHIGQLSKALAQITPTQIVSANFSQCIAFAGLPKDRAEATAWCQSLLFAFRQEIPHSQSAQTLLLQAMEYIQQNANVKLVLEHCFFQIKDAVSMEKN